MSDWRYDEKHSSPRIANLAVYFSDREIQLSRVSLDEMLAIKGIDLSKPYRIMDLGNGSHRVDQTWEIATMEEGVTL